MPSKVRKSAFRDGSRREYLAKTIYEPRYGIVREAGNGGKYLFVLPQPKGTIAVLAGNYNIHQERNGIHRVKPIPAAHRGTGN